MKVNRLMPNNVLTAPSPIKDVALWYCVTQLVALPDWIVYFVYINIAVSTGWFLYKVYNTRFVDLMRPIYKENTDDNKAG